MLRLALKNPAVAGLLVVILLAVLSAAGPSAASMPGPGKNSPASAPPLTFKASGRVVAAHITRGGWRFEPVPNVVMTFTSGACCGAMPPGPVKTDSEGRWVADVPMAGTSGGLYVVTPRKRGFIFKPKSIAFTEAHPWLEELNFQENGR